MEKPESRPCWSFPYLLCPGV
uniref:Ras and Rab interactor 2 n=1 Tax=Molossus molossus TaxID=27622 RepID=A0A7J8HJR7_MOLMO|nr:Ras and Rab interactor 2 [Molossus molossus]